MATPDQKNPPENELAKPAPSGAQPRSENLLPADSGQDDALFNVAEEVNLDQQSDKARHIGQAPSTNPQDDAADGTPAAR
jgi:hypothetical protein